VNLTAPGEWWRTTWEANRAFAGTLVAALLAVLAVSTAGGAFGGPEAAAAAAAAGGQLPVASSMPANPDGLPAAPSVEPSFAPIPAE
jgi:hypothetical protein